ncbi:odorant receptor 9a isoform X2 [Monomorium pharaonis]|uniref:odorant receptor 9a isoform X2 n=1 Tax=Monomorium pharaonis TaxID=307658 RepID=UPI00063EFBE8|nr:odorant receptor 9a isoform X2 [Monomorium pharaonis]
MTDKQYQAYKTYQRFTQICLTIGGCWYMPTKSGKPAYYWPVCVVCLTIMNAVIRFNLIYISRHNLVHMMKFVGNLMSAIGCLIKVISFLINRGSLINHHRTLNESFEEEFMQNKKIRTMILSSQRKIYIVTYTYTTILVTLLLMIYAASYIHIIRDLFHLRLTINYTLPMSKGYGYFWSVPDNFLYHLHLLIETILSSLGVVTASGVDSIFGFYVYQFVSTLRFMTFRLSNNLSIESFSDQLRTYIKKHQKLLQCRNTLEHVYGPIILWHVITNAMFMCTMMYEMIHLSNFNLRYVLIFLMYTSVKLFQTFIYAWCGTILTNASEDFRNGIYFGKWHNSKLDHYVRVNVILMLMQKPMTIKAIFLSVDIVMFANLIHATVSYFFLLKSLSDKGE